MGEVSLADYLPLWRTLRENDVTAMVTPSLDYVGAMEVTTVDPRFASEEAIAGFGEQLRNIVASAEDGWSLHFLYRVTTDVEADLREYDASSQSAGAVKSSALSAYVKARSEWLRQQPLRKTRLFLFFSRRRDNTRRSALGFRMLFAKLGSTAAHDHEAELTALRAQRNAVKTRLEAVGLRARELSVADVHAVLHELLNPTHAARRWPVPKLRVLDNFHTEEAINRFGAHLREYTEAEQLCREELVEDRDVLRQEATWRRAMTLKQLPEGGTDYLATEAITRLVESDGLDVQPFSFWFSVALNIESQGGAKMWLDIRHNTVDLFVGKLAALKPQSVSRDAENKSKRAGIEGLLEEVATLNSKIVTVSCGLLLDAPSLEVLNARTEAARGAFAKAGNSELMMEEVSQLPAFLSMLPGAGPYQHRKKMCTSRNAADFLPVAAPWPGTSRAASILWTPTRDIFRFDFFDSSLPAHHGLVMADTGSGKSVSLGAFTLDALGAGHDAILVDNGRSWERFTRLLGGIHINVDIQTAITPFLPWSEVANAKGDVDADVIEDVVTFLELCVRDVDLPSFNKLQLRVVSAAVRHAYESRFRFAPDERPLMHHFRDALRAVVDRTEAHADDKAIAENVYRRLGLFVGDEQYGRFLDRPSTLRFDANLVCFEMEGMARSGAAAQSIAFATVMRAISARASAARKRGSTRRTLVEIDEGHTWLGKDETAERFLETSYRVMRKYGVAMWMVSQNLEDFRGVKAGRAIINNSAVKLFLYHASGHGPIAEFFGLTPNAQQAFMTLQRRGGHYSDMLLLSGQRRSVVRLALHPLALWLLTTAPADKDFIAAARAKNPRLPELELLMQLAKHYPHGAPELLKSPSSTAA